MQHILCQQEHSHFQPLTLLMEKYTKNTITNHLLTDMQENGCWDACKVHEKTAYITVFEYDLLGTRTY